jgi:SP family myo-inositol transporter-like MFS transporter 13
MLPIRRAFDLTPSQQEVVVSVTIVAAFVSSLFGGTLNLKFGRRISILFAASVFTLGSLILMFAYDYLSLVVGRIVVGVGIGVASLTTPIYIAEVAIPRMRGKLVTINTLMVTFGYVVFFEETVPRFVSLVLLLTLSCCLFLLPPFVSLLHCFLL